MQISYITQRVDFRDFADTENLIFSQSNVFFCSLITACNFYAQNWREIFAIFALHVLDSAFSTRYRPHRDAPQTRYPAQPRPHDQPPTVPDPRADRNGYKLRTLFRSLEFRILDFEFFSEIFQNKKCSF